MVVLYVLRIVWVAPSNFYLKLLVLVAQFQDFAMEADENHTRSSAGLMVASLAGSLAHVTCKVDVDKLLACVRYLQLI